MYKLKVLRQLRERSLLIVEIEQSLGLLKRETRELTQSLVQDINKIFKKLSCNKLLVHRNHLTFNPPITEEQYVEFLDRIKEMYLFNSSLYKLLMFVLAKRKFTIIEVANFLSYSESHSYKILNKLKKLFNLLQTNINLNKEKQGYFTIIGEQSSIRLLHYFSIILVFRTHQWPFINISEQEVMEIQKYINYKSYNELSPLNKKKSDYLIAIYKNALNTGNTVSFLADDVVALGECIIKNNEKNLYFNHLKKEKITNEIIRFSFLSNYFTQELLTVSDKEKLGKILCTLKKNTIVDNAMS